MHRSRIDFIVAPEQCNSIAQYGLATNVIELTEGQILTLSAIFMRKNLRLGFLRGRSRCILASIDYH